MSNTETLHAHIDRLESARDNLRQELAAAGANAERLVTELQYQRSARDKAMEELAAARKELRDITAPLPEAFYPELPLAKRVEYMAQVNTGLVLGNQQLQQERDALAAALAGFNSLAATLSLLPRDRRTRAEQMFVEQGAKCIDKVEAILATRDAAKDAEIVALVEALQSLMDAETEDAWSAAVKQARAALAPYKTTKENT